MLSLYEYPLDETVCPHDPADARRPCTADPCQRNEKLCLYVKDPCTAAAASGGHVPAPVMGADPKRTAG